MSAGCRVNREARSKLKPKAKNTRSQWRRGCSTRRSGRHPRPRRTRRTAPPVGRRWPAFESGRPAPECQQPAPAGYRPRFQPRRAVRPAVQVSWWGVGGEMVGCWWGVGRPGGSGGPDDIPYRGNPRQRSMSLPYRSRSAADCIVPSASLHVAQRSTQTDEREHRFDQRFDQRLPCPSRSVRPRVRRQQQAAGTGRAAIAARSMAYRPLKWWAGNKRRFV